MYDFFFQTVAEKVTHHQCRKCNKVRKQNLAHGYANLIGHLRDEHANYEEDARVVAQNEFQFAFTVTKKASNIFSWLRWITLKGLPFSFVKDNLTAEYTNLKHITRQTFVTYVEKLPPLEVVQQADTPSNRRVNNPTDIIASENNCTIHSSLNSKLAMNTFGPIR